MQVMIALRRPSDSELSESKPFLYLPQEFGERNVASGLLFVCLFVFMFWEGEHIFGGKHFLIEENVHGLRCLIQGTFKFVLCFSFLFCAQ